MDTLVINLLVLVVSLLIFNTLWLVALSFAHKSAFLLMSDELKKLHLKDDEVSQDVKNIGFSTPFIELHSRVLNIEKLLTDSKRDEA